MEIHNPTMRVIRVLEAISSHNGELTMSEISKITNIPRGTLAPILKTLYVSKYIFIDHDSQKYSIDLRLFLIGIPYANESSSYRGINRIISLVSQKSGETVHLGILDNENVLYVAKHESSQAVRVFTSVGKELPAYGTALGKALLCNYSLPQLIDLYPKGLNPITTNTITNFNVLFEQLQDIKTTGFAYETEESSYGIQCIAKPIYVKQSIVAAISIAFPVFRYSEEKISEFKKILNEGVDFLRDILPYTNFV